MNLFGVLVGLGIVAFGAGTLLKVDNAIVFGLPVMVFGCAIMIEMFREREE